jgi:hypothetical protein
MAFVCHLCRDYFRNHLKGCSYGNHVYDGYRFYSTYTGTGSRDAGKPKHFPDLEKVIWLIGISSLLPEDLSKQDWETV